ncbi:DUF3253 domain-containing protein [Pseudaestuariivita atlantica]|uniref:S-adenosylmethionine tRNA ribosyltransferase n=1 Tax=Pseudaestuariivita atlantica TaxID=1317121 RepID=A0A0L1JQP5_9RHOB|nr:DUF3253 domain-containing protein [Pseudaestuariivita atlantica]KNG94109.1 hypothetical protein ATO11_07650 [Pseudaestuariivita atlantica]
MTKEASDHEGAPDAAEIRVRLIDLAVRRGATKTFCPSEVARSFGPGWRDLMPRVRAEAAGMADLRATQKGVEVDAMTAKGPIRLGLRA